MLPTLIFTGTAALFTGMALASLRDLRWMHRLPQLQELPTSSVTPLPRCSVIIAARNEEARIENAIRHLLQQTAVTLEIIVVDDRSTDQTTSILDRLAAEDTRVRTLRVDVLPDGWLGKCHACHLGAASATGDWILFTDADCWLSPDMIARSIILAHRDNVDHVTLTSGLAVKTPGLKISHLAFLMTFTNWFSGVNRDLARSYLGFGAFNLVRAAAYRECGGYQALRLTILDDVKLGLLLRRAGKKSRAFLGGSDVECHWGTTAWSIVKIMEKNYFAALEFRSWLAFLGVMVVAVFSCILVFGFVSGTPAGIAAALSPFTSVLPASILARRLGWSWLNALGVPFMVPLFVYTLLHSTIVTLRQGGVRWRDTFYPIETLRAQGVR